MVVLEKEQIDLTDASKFPDLSMKWQSGIVILDHLEEVDSVSVMHIYDLLSTVMAALKSRGTSAF